MSIKNIYRFYLNFVHVKRNGCRSVNERQKASTSLWRLTPTRYCITYWVTYYEILPYAENEGPVWFQQVPYIQKFSQIFEKSENHRSITLVVQEQMHIETSKKTRKDVSFFISIKKMFVINWFERQYHVSGCKTNSFL